MPHSDEQPYAAANETHTGVVFSLGDRAYKLKKPVRFSAMDFRSRENRLSVCRREVELNSRLAPDVYLGLADVRGQDGEVCDHMVVMRRLPTDTNLAGMVDSGSATAEQVRVIARTMADFHAGARRSPEIDEQAGSEALGDRWSAILDQVGEFRDTVLDSELVTEIADRTQEFVAGRSPLFEQRIADRRVVDGHGDLLAGDVFLLDDGPRALDCLEFDDRLRYLDAIDDMATLAMDLEHRGAGELAAALLEEYQELADDPAPAALRHHYIGYRALVRVLTSCVRADQLGDTEKAESLRDDARTLAELAVVHLRDSVPKLVLTGGPPGTGKSTLSERLGDEIGATVISSDRLRKELAGLDPAEDPDSDELYDQEHTWRTYRTMIEQAKQRLALGEPVILDASWAKERHRRLADAAAAETHSGLVPLRCVVPGDVATERVRNRETPVSDADENIAAAIAADADPWPNAHDVDTGGTVRESVDNALAALNGSRDRS